MIPAAGAHVVFHVDAFHHPLCRFLSGCSTQIAAERDKRLIAVAVVKVNIGVYVFAVRVFLILPMREAPIPAYFFAMAIGAIF